MNGKVYKITNNVTGESYIGKTIRTIEERFEEHCHGTERDDGRRSRLQKAMAEYGYRNFSIELLMDEIESQERLDQVETGYMMVYNTLEEYNAVKSYSGGERQKEREGLVVSYHRDLNAKRLSHLTTLESNLLMIILGYVGSSKSDLITIPFDECKKLLVSKRRNPSDIELLVVNIKKKLKEDIFNGEDLFSVLDFNYESYEIEAQINDKFNYLITSPHWKQLVSFYYEDFGSLKYSYSKSLFRLLSQFNSTGYYVVKTEELRTLLGCPESYNTGRFHKIVLDKAMLELDKYFKDLSVEKILQGNKVVRYEFTFTQS